MLDEIPARVQFSKRDALWWLEIYDKTEGDEDYEAEVEPFAAIALTPTLTDKMWAVLYGIKQDYNKENN